MPTFAVECPRCHTQLQLPPHLNGRWIDCPKCQFGFAAFSDEDAVDEGPRVFHRPPPVYAPPTRVGILNGTGGAIIAGVSIVFVGLVLSQYWPVFGGFLERAIAAPWSPARKSLIPLHLLVFTILGLMVAGVLAFCFMALRWNISGLVLGVLVTAIFLIFISCAGGISQADRAKRKAPLDFGP